MKDLLAGWRKILSGRAPMLSIEITRECPLHCPGCYAYGENHLGGGTTLRQLSDFRGDALVEGVLGLVRKHCPVHVSLVGGEPMIRHRELNRILPVLGQLGIHTLLVTSGVIAVPKDWMNIPRLRVVVSVDGLPEHHDVRRKPATYERILANIRNCTVNIHWVITHPMLQRRGYLEEYLSFWSARAEVDRIWASTYSPQMGEQSLEMLTPEDKEQLIRQLPALGRRYPKFLISRRIVRALREPPRNPRECLFSIVSTNYSADLNTRVEPCVLGGTPDCSQCGCIASVGLHSVNLAKVVGPLKVDHLIRASIAVGRCVARFRRGLKSPERWHAQAARGRGFVRRS
jgi:MoaA/NifB/PqqE/SkfB family radical SAM enzyme